jgi:DNA processing protein
MHRESKELPQDSFSSSPLLSRLLTLPQIPKQLFIQGDLPPISIDEQGYATPRILTVVGSRKYSSYGKDVVKFLMESLRGEPVIIVSGLALGIDALAHTYALENNLQTIAIPGSGLGQSVLYPKNNITLAEKILTSGGCLLSEYGDTISAEKWTFPARNRLMAALSDAVLIIEADLQSGTLITGRHALELGKDIGVVPGSIFSPNARGPLSLIKEGATPIASKEDLFELLRLTPNILSETKDSIPLEEDERKIYELLSETCNKDTLLVISELTPERFMVALTTLEMKGYIQETFGEVRRVV